MKIRTSFVSNSSSTSYTILVEKKTFEKALEKTSDLTKKIVKHVTAKKCGSFLKKEFYVIEYVIGNDDSFSYFELDKDTEKKFLEEYIGCTDILNDFINSLNKDKIYKTSFSY